MLNHTQWAKHITPTGEERSTLEPLENAIMHRIGFMEFSSPFSIRYVISTTWLGTCPVCVGPKSSRRENGKEIGNGEKWYFTFIHAFLTCSLALHFSSHSVEKKYTCIRVIKKLTSSQGKMLTKNCKCKTCHANFCEGCAFSLQ